MDKIFIKSLDELKNYKSHDRLYFYCEKCGKESSKEKYVFRDKLLCGACKKVDSYMNKYGVTNIFCVKEIKERAIKSSTSESGKQKRKETCLKKYGTEYACSSKEAESKRKETCLQRYGSEYFFASDEGKTKVKTTKLEKYGHENPSIKNVYCFDNNFFDSSYELYYYIYCKDHEINIQRNYKPFKMQNGRKCHPDFIVDGQIIEIKSRYLTQKPDWKYKEACYKENNIKVLYDEDIVFYRNYVDEKYGKQYIKQFKSKTRIEN